MGTLKPGATYIYERNDGIVYAREFGKTERKEIGRSYDPRTNDGRPLHDHIMEDKMWNEIRQSAKTNPALQEALDRVRVLYELSKDE